MVLVYDVAHFGGKHRQAHIDLLVLQCDGRNRFVGDDLEDHFIQSRFFIEFVVALQHYLGVDHMLHKFVSARAHRLVFKIPVLLHGLPGDDVVLIHLVLPQHIDVVCHKLNGLLIHHIDLFQSFGQFGVTHRAIGRVQIVLVGKFHIFRSDLDLFVKQAVARLPIYIVTNLDSPGQAVFTALPLCSQRRYKVGILIHFHQCVVDLTEDIAVAVRSGLPRYQGGNRHVGADDQLIGVFYHFTTGAGPAAVIVVVFLVIAAIFGTGAEQHHRGQSQRNQGHPFFLQHNLLSYLCVLLGPGCLPGTSSAVLPPSGLALCLRPLLFLCFYLLTLYLYVRDYHKLYKK